MDCFFCFQDKKKEQKKMMAAATHGRLNSRVVDGR
jgi:hypothetical protein